MFHRESFSPTSFTPVSWRFPPEREVAGGGGRLRRFRRADEDELHHEPRSSPELPTDRIKDGDKRFTVERGGTSAPSGFANAIQAAPAQSIRSVQNVRQVVQDIQAVVTDDRQVSVDVANDVAERRRRIAIAVALMMLEP